MTPMISYDTEGGRTAAVMNEEKVHLRLYISRGSPNSRMAVQNLAEIRTLHLAERSSLEVIDLFDEPLRALEEGVMMTPTLVLASCDPPVRIVGNLSDPAPVLEALKVIFDEHV